MTKTRKEQIEEAAVAHCSDGFYRMAFNHGAEWADRNPVEVLPDEPNNVQIKTLLEAREQLIEDWKWSQEKHIKYKTLCAELAEALGKTPPCASELCSGACGECIPIKKALARYKAEVEGEK